MSPRVRRALDPVNLIHPDTSVEGIPVPFLPSRQKVVLLSDQFIL